MFSILSPKLVKFLHLNTKCHRSYVLALFTNFSVVAAVLPIMAKISVISKSECVNSWKFLDSLGKKVKDDHDSAIKEHLLFCNHTPHFEDVSILPTNSNDFKVTLMESLQINRDHPPFNKNKQSYLWNLLIAKEQSVIIW